jgi:hypothetical protein
MQWGQAGVKGEYRSILGGCAARPPESGMAVLREFSRTCLRFDKVADEAPRFAKADARFIDR